MTFSGSKIIKSLDIFSLPFFFFVGPNKSKHTFIGGIFTLCIISLSVAYFYYLMNMYFSNQIEPTITQSNIIESNEIIIKTKGSFFMFEMLINKEPLKQYEKRVGKVFLIYEISYQTLFGDKIVESKLSYGECSDSNLLGYLCINENELKDKDIILEPINNDFASYVLTLRMCDDSIDLLCAPEQEIIDLVMSQQNYLQLYTKIQQYNPQKRQFEVGYKSDYFILQSNTFLYTRFSLIKCTTNVSEGMIIQFTESRDHIYDFQRIDLFLPPQQSQIAQLTFEVNQTRTIINVQHAMITQVLSQFMSIFNFLLILGIIAKMLAQAHIVEDVSNILLKQYYKKTAAQLLRKKKIEKIQSISKKGMNVSQEKDKDLSSKVKELQNDINNEKFTKNKSQYFELNYFKRFKYFLLELLGKKQISNQESSKSQKEEQVYQKLLNQSIKCMNIQDLFKDLMQIKMVIKLMLTKEQYAALQFCGSQMQESDAKNVDKISSTKINFLNSKSKIIIENSTLKPIEMFSKSQIDIQSPIKKEEALLNNINLHFPSTSFFKNNKLPIQNQSDYVNQGEKTFNEVSNEFFFTTVQNRKQGNKTIVDQINQTKGDLAIDMRESNIIDFQSEKVEEIEDDELNKYLKNFSHLYEMDFIEENEDAQVFFLKQFLSNMKSSNNQYQNEPFNKKIYDSLLLNDKELSKKEDQVPQIEISSHDKFFHLIVSNKQDELQKNEKSKS